MTPGDERMVVWQVRAMLVGIAIVACWWWCP